MIGQELPVSLNALTEGFTEYPQLNSVLANKIKSFSLLKTGWSYDNSASIAPSAISAALKLLMVSSGFLDRIEAMPGLNGEVLLYYHYSVFSTSVVLEFSIFSESDISLVIERDDEEVISFLNLNYEKAALTIIYRYWENWGSWNTLESSILSLGIESKKDFEVPHLPQVGNLGAAVFQSSKQSVLKRRKSPFVNTLSTIIPRMGFPQSRIYSGSLKPMNYHKALQ